MRGLATLAAIESQILKNARDREKLKSVRWLRHNASSERGLTDLPDEDENFVGGIIDAITVREETGGNRDGSTGTTGGVQPAPGAGGGVPQKPPEETRTEGPGDGNTGGSRPPGGSDQGSHPHVDPGAGAKPSAEISGSPSGSTWVRKAITYAGIAAGGAGVGSGLTAALNWAVSGRPHNHDVRVEAGVGKESPPGYTHDHPQFEQEYPLLDMLEERGRHLHPEER